MRIPAPISPTSTGPFRKGEKRRLPDPPGGRFPAVTPARRVDAFPDSEGSWAVVPRGVCRTVEPGQAFEIRIYICGWGVPSWTKLAFYPPPELFDDTYREPGGEGSGGIETGPIVVQTPTRTMGADAVDISNPASPVTYEWAYIHPETTGFATTGGLIGLLPANFLPLLDPDRPPGNPDELIANTGRGDRMTVSEADLIGRGGAHAPFILRARISPTAIGGDYTIPFVLTYAHGSKVQTSEADLEIHVRPWWEQKTYQYVLAAIGVIVVGASVADVVLHFIG
jgi:hypothetical protein